MACAITVVAEHKTKGLHWFRIQAVKQAGSLTGIRTSSDSLIVLIQVIFPHCSHVQ